MSPFWRFATWTLISLAAFAAVTVGLQKAAAFGPLVAGVAGLLAGTTVIFVWQSRKTGSASFALPALLFLSLAIDYALYAALIMQQPLLEPRAVLVWTSVAALAFAAAGYLRLKSR